MNESKEVYYCSRCGKYTEQFRVSAEEYGSEPNSMHPRIGRVFGAIADYTGIGKVVDFMLDNYEYKCCVCGKRTCRNSIGEEVPRK